MSTKPEDRAGGFSAVVTGASGLLGGGLAGLFASAGVRVGAIPILLGETLRGVLDMQDDVAGDIYPEDIEYLTAISNQTAIALQNSRSILRKPKRKRSVKR